MTKDIEKLKVDIDSLSSNPKNVKFNDLAKICETYFPDFRQNGTSHLIFKTHWQNNPMINIQRDKNSKMAKGYQVIQVVKILSELKRELEKVNDEE